MKVYDVSDRHVTINLIIVVWRISCLTALFEFSVRPDLTGISYVFIVKVAVCTGCKCTSFTAVPTSTQPFTLCETVKWKSAFILSNKWRAWPTCRLMTQVSWLTMRVSSCLALFYIHQMNQAQLCNGGFVSYYTPTHTNTHRLDHRFISHFPCESGLANCPSTFVFPCVPVW